MQTIVVPDRIRVGYNNRSDTFNGKLGFMIYANKANGEYGQEKSFTSWIDKAYGENIFKNEFMPGFVMNKGVLNKHDYGAYSRFRIFHPQGFEFEISQENLNFIISTCNLSAGEIETPCRIGWLGSRCFLIPEKTEVNKLFVVEEYKTRDVAQETQVRVRKGKYALAASLKDGKIYEHKSGVRYVVVAPTQKNAAKVELGTKYVNDRFGFMHVEDVLEFGFDVQKNNNAYFEKFLYPLSGTNNIVDKIMFKEMIKEVSQEELTPEENKTLRNLKCFYQVGMQLPKGITLSPLKLNEEDFHQEIMKGQGSKKFLFSPKVVKIKDHYHVMVFAPSNFNEYKSLFRRGTGQGNITKYNDDYPNQSHDFTNLYFVNIGDLSKNYEPTMTKVYRMEIATKNGEVNKAFMQTALDWMWENADEVTEEELSLYKPIFFEK